MINPRSCNYLTIGTKTKVSHKIIFIALPREGHQFFTLHRPQFDYVVGTDSGDLLAQLLKGEGMEVSVTVVDQLLEKHNYRKRKAVKTLATGESGQRNEQFETIEQLKQSYQASGNPVISMDTKKES
jgi:hypothetical protein